MFISFNPDFKKISLYNAYFQYLCLCHKIPMSRSIALLENEMKYLLTCLFVTIRTLYTNSTHFI